MFRFLASQLKANLHKDYGDGRSPIQVLYGARRVGKSTLLKNTFPHAKYINIEVGEYIDILNSRNIDAIRSLVPQTPGSSDILILDEFQRLENPGLIAKIIFDELPHIRLILSGSSTIEITNKASESMAGRAIFLTLFPLSIFEKCIQDGQISEADFTSKNIDVVKLNPTLLEALRFGLYPLPSPTLDQSEYLQTLIDSSISKDIIYLDVVKNTKVIQDLLVLLAGQIGQLVNYSEIANRLGIDRQTVQKYIQVLEKLFIIFTLKPYRNKRRDEIGLAEKVYFYDVGIRNALMRDFKPVTLRTDVGFLFENFIIAEIIKSVHYFGLNVDLRYWRTKSGSEVDLVFVRGSEPVRAFEIKYGQGAFPRSFTNTYTIPTQVIHSNNYLSELISLSRTPRQSL